MKPLICSSLFLVFFFSHQAMSVFVAKEAELSSYNTNDVAEYLVHVVDFQENLTNEVSVVGRVMKETKRLYSIIYIGIASHDKNIMEKKIYERMDSRDLVCPDRFKLRMLEWVRPEAPKGLFSIGDMIREKLELGKFNRLLDEEEVNELAQVVEERILNEPAES